MEVLAIGLLGLAGKYISDRFANQTEDEHIEKYENNLDEDVYTTSNGFDQKNKVLEAMDSVTLQKKILSQDPNNNNIIPNLYNKRVYTLDNENKYLSSNKNFNNTNGETMLKLYEKSRNLMEGPANELTTLDEQFSPMVINNSKATPSNMGKLTLPESWTPYNKNDDDMTYKIFNKEELIHNNMQPFFKDKGLLITEDNSRNMEQKLDIYTGSSRFYFAKKEIPNIIENFDEGFSTAFAPVMMSSYTRGTPNQVDLIQDRYFSGKEKKAERPFDQVQVTPGLNISPYEDGKVGFHDPYNPPTRTIDELRRADNPQISETHLPIKGANGQGNRGIVGDVANRKPVTYGELDKDYNVMPTITTVQGPTDIGNFNFDKSHRGNLELFEQGGMGPGNFEAVVSKDNFGAIREPFKTTLAGLNQSIIGGGDLQTLPNLDKSTYNNYITQRSTANSTYTGGLGNNTNGNGEVSTYQPTITQRLNTNANYTGIVGGENFAGEMSTYQPTITHRLNTNTNYTGIMGNNANGTGEVSMYQSLNTQRATMNTNYTGVMGTNANGTGEVSMYQPLNTQRATMNTNYTGVMGTNANGTGEVSTYQPLNTQRATMNTNYTGIMGNNANGTGEVSMYQPMSTLRADMNANFTGSMGGGYNTGEMSMYQPLSTNRIISNNLMGLPVSQIGGNGHFSTTTNPVATMRVNSTPLAGYMGLENMGGYIAQNVTPMQTERQAQNASFTGPIAGSNSVNSTSTGSGERNMYFRDNKESLLMRNSPTPVNAYQPPNSISNGDVSLKNYQSNMLSSTGLLPTSDYLPFYSNLKNIAIPTTYPNYYPPDMEYNNPYINNSLFKAKNNVPNNIDNFFNQFSNDSLNN